jgi:hypothetical protein
MTFEKYPTARVRAGSILRRAADGRRFVVRSVRRKPADDVELTHQRSAPGHAQLIAIAPPPRRLATI